jgi:hypothetical protein
MNCEVVRLIEVFPEIENRLLALSVRGAYCECAFDLRRQLLCVTGAIDAGDQHVVCVPAKVFGLERNTFYNRVNKDRRNAADQQLR